MDQTETDQFAVIILGMHRSGTSCLAGSLQRRGLHLGPVVHENPDNLRGNREHKPIRLLNDAVLAASGGSWDKPPGEIVWSARNEVERDKIVQRLSAPGKSWGFKDPRALITLPFWKARLADFKMVGTFRHPLAVARSLNARNGFPIEHGLALWKTYNLSLLSLMSDHGFPLISFDAPAKEYGGCIERMASLLGIGGDEEPDADSFFDRALRHQEIDSEGASLPADISGIYVRLNRIHEMTKAGFPLS